MATVFIDGKAISLHRRFAEGDVMDEIIADILNSIQKRRIMARIRYMLRRREISEAEAPAKILQLYEEELTLYSIYDDEDNPDPILEEAMGMARELIVTRMAQEGLPPPKGLDTHARALVDGMPDLQEKARLRVEARYQAAQAALGELMS